MYFLPPGQPPALPFPAPGSSPATGGSQEPSIFGRYRSGCLFPHAVTGGMLIIRIHSGRLGRAISLQIALSSRLIAVLSAYSNDFFLRAEFPTIAGAA